MSRDVMGSSWGAAACRRGGCGAAMASAAPSAACVAPSRRFTQVWRWTAFSSKARDSCRSVSPTARGDSAGSGDGAACGDDVPFCEGSTSALSAARSAGLRAAVAAAAAAADAAAAASSSAMHVALGGGEAAGASVEGPHTVPLLWPAAASSWAAPLQATAQARAPRAAKAAREATAASSAAGTADSVNSSQETWRPQLAATA
mmetsp:Transcript_31231/g.92957  ORF Transcript_31231/g.92957 Transcript_31231/m.92957 type:complete len:203 (-) Transcript_31231:52-660(-)